MHAPPETKTEGKDMRVAHAREALERVLDFYSPARGFICRVVAHESDRIGFLKSVLRMHEGLAPATPLVFTWGGYVLYDHFTLEEYRIGGGRIDTDIAHRRET